jgi:hypothetical protein
MKDLFKYRKEFDENEVYLYSPFYQLYNSKPVLDRGSWWFTGGLKVKAQTVKCVKYSELLGKTLEKQGCVGRITSYALHDTPYIGIYWSKITRKGCPYFWQEALKMIE